MRCIAVAVVLALLLTVRPAAATPTDFSFKDVEIGSVLQTIATMGKINVIVCSGADRHKVVFVAQQLEPLDAMELVARQAGLAVVRVRHEEGSPQPTFVVGTPDQVKAWDTHTRSFQLRYAPAAEVGKALSERVEAWSGSKLLIDERANRLQVSGTQEVISQVEAVLRDADLPVPHANVLLSLTTGPADRPQTIWSGNTLVQQGRQAQVDLSAAGTQAATHWRLTRLVGRITARINSDNFCSLSVQSGVSLERNGATASAKWNTDLQVADTEEVVVGTLEVAPGELVALRVKPTVVKQDATAPTGVPTCTQSAGPVDDLDVDPDPSYRLPASPGSGSVSPAAP